MKHLAIDIGASSGRHIVAWRENGELVMKEVYRFTNLPKEEQGHLIWNIERLCDEVINGMKACSAAGFHPDSIGLHRRR